MTLVNSKNLGVSRTNLDEGRPSRFVGLFESPAPPDGDERPDWGFSISITGEPPKNLIRKIK